MKRATFFHLGDATGQDLLTFLDLRLVDLEMVDLSANPDRVDECRMLGVQSLPALVVDGEVFHVNPTASLHVLEAMLNPQVGAAAFPQNVPEIPEDEPVEATSDLELVEAGHCRSSDCDYL